jgi:hypothetical protein
VKRGLPLDNSKTEEYINKLSAEAALLTQWLEQFKSRFGEHEEAVATINSIESALRLFAKLVGGSKLAVELQRALNDRSIFEFGIEWHLERFVKMVSVHHVDVGLDH